MKKISLLSLLLALATLSFSQDSTSSLKKIYAIGGIGDCSNNGIASQLGLQMVFKKNWTASISYHNIEMDPSNLPANYIQGYTVILIFPINDPMPVNNMTTVSVSAGKLLPTGRRTWFIAEAGVSFVSGEVAKFSPQQSVESYNIIGWSKSSNYAVTKTKESTVGGLIKLDFNWAFLPWVGLGAGVYANLNSNQSLLGYQLTLSAGWMNIGKKHKH